MSSYFFPPFDDFSEALMASLASRSHEWTYWEIIEKKRIDSAALSELQLDANKKGVPAESQKVPGDELEIELCVRSKGSAEVRRILQVQSETSPSLFLDQVFDTLQCSAQNSSLEPSSFSSIKKNWTAFATEPLAREELARLFQSLHTPWAILIRAKNSHGEYLETLQAPKT